MKSRAPIKSWGFLGGVAACLVHAIQAQIDPTLELRMYAGITITGEVGTAYSIQWTTNVLDPNGWMTLTNLVLLASPTVYYDADSPSRVKRFYRTIRVNSDSPHNTSTPIGMVLIPTGSFIMGDQEAEVVSVEVDAFYIDPFEVTQALWDEVKSWAVQNGYSFDYTARGKGPSHPVHSVSWYDAVKWCNARSEREGRIPAYYLDATQTSVYRFGNAILKNSWVMWCGGYRLPTEAEWEKAARGGLVGLRFPWGNTIMHSQANYDSAGRRDFDLSTTQGYHPDFQIGGLPYTCPVGSFAPNKYGLYDMTGNVNEWCWNWWGPIDTNYLANPHGLDSGSERVTRGGGWTDDAYWSQVWIRGRPCSDYYNNRGFRTVLAPYQL
jgi:formylglycine-generating enzyme